MSHKRHPSSTNDPPAKRPRKAASKSAISTKILKPTEQYVYLAVEEEYGAYQETQQHVFELFASKEDANRRLEVRRTGPICEHFNDDDWEIEYDKYGCFHAKAEDQEGSGNRFDVRRMKVQPEGSVPTVAVAKEQEDAKSGKSKSQKSKTAGYYDLETGEDFSDGDRSWGIPTLLKLS